MSPLLSLVYRLVRCLSGLLAVLVRSDLSKDADRPPPVAARPFRPAGGPP
jgi:hypothetical protein